MPLINMPHKREQPRARARTAMPPGWKSAHAERYTGTGGERLISQPNEKGRGKGPEMIAGDWPNAAGRNLIRPPPSRRRL